MLFRVLGLLLVGLLIGASLLAWRLSQGPILLDFLTPAIEEALAARDGSLTVRLGSTVLMAGDNGRLLEIHAFDVRAFGPGDQQIAVAPDMSFNLSGRALLAGIVAPNTIQLYGPRLKLQRDPDGRVHMGVNSRTEASEPTAESEAVAAAIRDALLGDPDPAKPGRTLQSLTIRSAEIIVDDQVLGRQWRIPESDLTFRRIETGLVVTGRARLELDGDTIGLDIEASYRKDNETADAVARFTALRPALLARFGGALTPMTAVDLPLTGSVHAKFDREGSVEQLDFDITGGAGSVTPPPTLAEGAIRIAGIEARGGYDRAAGRINLARLKLDFGGPTLAATGSLDGLAVGGGPVRLDAVVHDLPVDRLHELWPQGVGQNARDWVIPNLSKGMVHEATLALVAHLPSSGKPEDLVIDHAGGVIRVDGVNVDYLNPMPPARAVAANVTYDAHSMQIALVSGEVFGLRLKDGLVGFTGLDQVDQFADIALTISGPIPDALRLLDSPPLRYAQALGIEPSKTGGEATTRLSLKFPLLKTLRLDDLDIRAQAAVKSLSLPKVAMGQDLEGGALDLTVDGKGLDAAGTVILGGLPATLSWRENFSAKGTAFRSRYHLKAAAVGDEHRRRLGLDAGAFLSGPVGADVTITFTDGGRGDIDGRLDLGPARLSLPGLGWSKEPGKPGTAEASIRLDHRQVGAIPRFTVLSGDLEARGSAAFGPDSTLRRVDLSRLVYGRTHGEGSVTLRQGGGFDVVFTGPSFDAEPVLSQNEESSKDSKPPPMGVVASVQSLWVSEKGAVHQTALSLHRDAQDWRAMSLKGTLDGGKSLSATLTSDAARRRSFTVTSEDAGAVARTFDVFDDLVGGDLVIDGYIDDKNPAQPLIGSVKVADYHIRNAPALARLLTVAALTGILDVLQGEGVGFSSLDAPFIYSNGLLELKDARAWGAALGITAKGQIDLDRSRLAIEGTVVPAYVLNSALGRIPILGWLITGGDKGGGVIAFNYTMKGAAADPSVTVNPLSALTPGFLRKLFNIFDDGSGTDARKGEGGAKTTP
ncbi:YhdP family protein [Magnetospirillum molischianum]|uniref:YhdP family protein n=1 Tax=Magnetospirillum molischianum TaxID=1083 RepID=UPI0002F4AF00|nr:AsmA-like C-terminal domain-containing protein [Magnetospirillum molischianum]